MFIIADARLPKKILSELQSYGQLLVFKTQNATYDAISGHPDIFLCQTPGKLVMAPNTPEEIAVSLLKSTTETVAGQQIAGPQYPASAAYNAFSNNSYLIHNLKYTDTTVMDQCAMCQPLHVNQGYTRCNLIEAKGLYITSDKGIEKVLKKEHLDAFYVDPKQILLSGERHGFFGGCAGVWHDELFLTGSLENLSEGNELQAELYHRHIHLIELYDGPLIDGGGILFL